MITATDAITLSRHENRTVELLAINYSSENLIDLMVDLMAESSDSVEYLTKYDDVIDYWGLDWRVRVIGY